MKINSTGEDILQSRLEFKEILLRKAEFKCKVYKTGLCVTGLFLILSLITIVRLLS